MKTKLSYQEYNEIHESLVGYHAVFYKFWGLVRPSYSDEVPTACVSFDPDAKCIDFLINKTFWDTLSPMQKEFIICHECMHVISSHFHRAGSKMSSEANQAMDVCVNESLVKYFGFDRSKFDPSNDYCWLDTVFEEKDEALPWHSFEYYYNLLIKKSEEAPQDGSGDGTDPAKSNQGGGGELINDHSGLGKLPEDASQEILDELSEEEAEVLENVSRDSSKGEQESGQLAGTGAGGLEQNIAKRSARRKKKWETLIKKFEKKMCRDESHEDNWALTPRRMHNLSSTLFLPSEIEQELRRTESIRIQTWFFMDTSGSCWDLAPRFHKAAASLDPDKFDVKYFAFDTLVYEVDLKKKKLKGGGGTSFRILTNFIYNQKKAKPHVWILTDGYGNNMNIPDNQRKKWNWFLTDNSTEQFVPKGCKVHRLKDFE